MTEGAPEITGSQPSGKPNFSKKIKQNTMLRKGYGPIDNK